MSQTDPLARAWKTTEGVVTVGLGTLIGALSAVDPSTLPHKYAVIVTGALAITLQVTRSWVKANASGAAVYHSNDLAQLLDEAATSPVTPDDDVAPTVPPVA